MPQYYNNTCRDDDGKAVSGASYISNADSDSVESTTVQLVNGVVGAS